MKPILLLFILLYSTILGQSNDYVFVGFRTNKSFSITSVEEQKESVKINFEYIGSYTERNFVNVEQKIKLTSGDKEAKLLNAINIPIHPKQKILKGGDKVTFSLIFEKIDIKNKLFNIIESDQLNKGYGINFFNVYSISSKSNYLTESKEDYFLSKIPRDLRFLFYYDSFINISPTIFENMMEYHIENSMPGIRKISLETKDIRGENIHAYNIEADNGSFTFYYEKAGNGLFEIKHISISFLDGKSSIEREKNAKIFLNSLIAWYGADIKKDRQGKDIGIYASNLNLKKIVLFNIVEQYKIYSVNINIIPDTNGSK